MAGQTHNQTILDNYDDMENAYDLSSCGSCLPELALYLNNNDVGIDHTVFSMTEQELNAAIVQVTGEIIDAGGYYSNLNNTQLSSVANQILFQMDSIIQSSVGFDDLWDNLTLLQNLAIETIECEDKNVVITTIEVAKYSAAMWAPLEGSTEGASSSLRNNDDECWKRAVAADGAASASFFTTLGVTVALGAVPGANGFIFAGWATSSGLTSSWYALTHCVDGPTGSDAGERIRTKKAPNGGGD